MERLKYLSLVMELRQIAVARAFSLLNEKEDAEDVAGETEDLFALEDGSEAEEGQWLIFRYLNKNNPSQQWKLIDKDGVVTIINKATGRCIDLAGGETKEGAAVFSYDINENPQSNANQKWIIEEAD